ncbi:Ail/Lom family outer membrane beta-barrel protein [Serratia fonticola]|uniref:Ail/Lom family outer membrane beta-barrel protein n=1 Tax=Serratia fonticola TaxID=47917 RepID=UPI003AFF8E80
MRKTYLSVLLAGAMALSFGVQAAGESTISLGYAQSHVKVDGNNLNENPKGFNLKYRYEIDNNLGFITSFTYTTQSYDFYYGSNKVGDGDLKYYSLTAGPAYRFNCISRDLI